MTVETTDRSPDIASNSYPLTSRSNTARQAALQALEPYYSHPISLSKHVSSASEIEVKPSEKFPTVLPNVQTAKFRTSASLSSLSSCSYQKQLISRRKTRLKECTHALILMVLLVCYILLGGCMFQQLEGNLALQRLHNFSLMSHRRHIRYYHTVRDLFRDENCASMGSSASSSTTQERLLRCNAKIRRLLESYDDEVFRLMDLPARVLRHNSDDERNVSDEDGPDDEETNALGALRLQSDWSWNYWNSAFFALSIVSTIGYGNMNCETTSGRLFTIVYALIGIPFTLATLNKLGDVLFHHICIFGHKLRHRLSTLFRRNSANLKDSEASELAGECINDNLMLHDSYPLWLALAIVLVYISVCAYFLALIEDEWDWFTSFYFFFISLSTIGLGDEMPQYHHYYTVYSFVLLLVGLALLSTCVAVMKARVEEQYTVTVRFLDGEPLARGVRDLEHS